MNRQLERLMQYAKIATLVDLKERLGLGYRDPRLHNIMNGKSKMTKQTALKLVKAFPEVSYEYLLTGEGPFFSTRPTDPLHHKLKRLENEITDMQHKIDFVYNINRKK